MPTHYQLDAAEIALVRGYRKASPIAREMLQEAIADAGEAKAAWIKRAIAAWREENTKHK